MILLNPLLSFLSLHPSASSVLLNHQLSSPPFCLSPTTTTTTTTPSTTSSLHPPTLSPTDNPRATPPLSPWLLSILRRQSRTLPPRSFLTRLGRGDRAYPLCRWSILVCNSPPRRTEKAQVLYLIGLQHNMLLLISCWTHYTNHCHPPAQMNRATFGVKSTSSQKCRMYIPFHIALHSYLCFIYLLFAVDWTQCCFLSHCYFHILNTSLILRQASVYS